MSDIKVPELAKSIAKYHGKSLDDAAISTTLIDLKQGVEGKASGNGIEAVFGANVALSVDLFNYPAKADKGGDKDPDRLLMSPAEQKPEDAKFEPLQIRPQLKFDAAHAWVKTQVQAAATAQATANVGVAGVKLSGDRKLRLMCYRRHSRSMAVNDGIAHGLSDFANPLSFSGVTSLKPGDACALAVRGALKLELSAKWSDVFAGTLGALADLVGSRADVLALKIEAGASVQFSASIEDDLLLCFSRADSDGRYRVALRKTHSRERKSGGKVQIVATFADEAAVTDLLGGGVIAALLDEPQAQLEAVIAATSLESVPKQLRPAVGKLLERLAERFGIQSAHPLKPVKETLLDLRKRALDEIKKIAAAKVEAGIACEYVRTKVETSLFEAWMSEEALKQLHKACVLFDLATLMAPHKGVEPLYFLNQKIEKTSFSWGVSLKIGPWLELGSKEKAFVHTVETEYRDFAEGTALFTRAAHCVLDCVDTYGEKIGRYGFSLRADNAQPAAESVADSSLFTTALEFKYGLSGLKGAKGIEQIAQLAPLWGVARQTGAVRERLAQALGSGTKFDARYLVSLDDETLRQAIAALRALPAQAYARHLARALPRDGMHAHRDEPALRERYCTPAVLACMQQPDAGPDALKSLIYTSLKFTGESKIYSWESAHWTDGETTTPATLHARVLQSGASGFWAALRRYQTGIARLAHLLEKPENWAMYPEAFAEMKAFLSQPWGLSAAISALVETRDAQDFASKGFAATLAVSWESNGTPATLVIARG